MTDTLILFSTPACHLCEEAAALLQAAGASYRVVDIAHDAVLLERYGLRIPVLRDALERELGWPFDPGLLAEFLNQG